MSIFHRHNKSIEFPQETFEDNLPSESIFESDNENVRYILKHLNPEKTQEIADFSQELMAQNFNESPDLSWQEDHLSFKDAENLRYYSGKAHQAINSYLRGFWNYEDLGPKTNNAVREVEETIAGITDSIQKLPRLNENIVTFRGTNIKSFSKYGVSSLSDLENLNGQLFYESAFTSTTISREKSFFKKDEFSKDGLPNNIEIEIFTPSGSHDGVAMTHKETSYYSDDESEYLFDKGSLFRIMHVAVENEEAKIKMALIPKELWEK